MSSHQGGLSHKFVCHLCMLLCLLELNTFWLKLSSKVFHRGQSGSVSSKKKNHGFVDHFWIIAMDKYSGYFSKYQISMDGIETRISRFLLLLLAFIVLLWRVHVCVQLQHPRNDKYTLLTGCRKSYKSIDCSLNALYNIYIPISKMGKWFSQKNEEMMAHKKEVQQNFTLPQTEALKAGRGYSCYGMISPLD
jgi:hypothetical protein